MGIFELIHKYLGIEELCLTLGCLMANAGRNGYKTGTFITKKIFFQKFYNFEYSVYVYICCSSVVVIGS